MATALRSVLAIAAISAVSSVNAAVVFTDNFSVGPQSVSQNAIGTNTSVSANAPVAGVNRTLTVEVLAQGADAANMAVTSGLFTLAAANTGTFGQANYGLGYSGALFAPYVAGTKGSISFDLTSLDQVPLNVTLLLSSYTGAQIAALPINSLTVPTTYTISGVGDYSAGFTLKFQGPVAYDFSIDNLRFQVPVAPPLVLLGIGMIAAGLASRRRKAA